MGGSEDGGRRRVDAVVALSVLGGAATGVVAFLAGVFALLPEGAGVSAAGLCFLAAAFAFGLLANGLIRR